MTREEIRALAAFIALFCAPGVERPKLELTKAQARAAKAHAGFFGDSGNESEAPKVVKAR